MKNREKKCAISTQFHRNHTLFRAISGLFITLQPLDCAPARRGAKGAKRPKMTVFQGGRRAASPDVSRGTYQEHIIT
jgi:hypothetical protein